MPHRCIRQARGLTDETRQIEKLIRSPASRNEDAGTITGMTGYVPFGALLIALGTGGIGRFADPKKLVSWMGMCPTVHRLATPCTTAG